MMIQLILLNENLNYIIIFQSYDNNVIISSNVCFSLIQYVLRDESNALIKKNIDIFAKIIESNALKIKQYEILFENWGKQMRGKVLRKKT